MDRSSGEWAWNACNFLYCLQCDTQIIVCNVTHKLLFAMWHTNPLLLFKPGSNWQQIHELLFSSGYLNAGKSINVVAVGVAVPVAVVVLVAAVLGVLIAIRKYKSSRMYVVDESKGSGFCTTFNPAFDQPEIRQMPPIQSAVNENKW